MISIAIPFHSGFGHTEAIAQRVSVGVDSVAGCTSTLIPVKELVDPGAPGWAVLDQADAIVMGCPTYMGSVSAEFKVWMDGTSKRWGEQHWRDKLAAGFTVSGAPAGDKLNVLTSLAVFAAQHSMVWVGTGLMMGPDERGRSINRLGSFLGLMAQADDGPPDVTPPEDDRVTAELFGRRVAGLAARWKGGAEG